MKISYFAHENKLNCRAKQVIFHFAWCMGLACFHFAAIKWFRHSVDG